MQSLRHSIGLIEFKVDHQVLYCYCRSRFRLQMHTSWWICLFSYHFLHCLSLLKFDAGHFRQESLCQELLKQLSSSLLLVWIFLSFTQAVCFALPTSFTFLTVRDSLHQNFYVSLRVQRVRLFLCKISMVKVPSLAAAP